MTLDEKIVRSIEAKFRELGLMFQDRDDADDGLGYLKDLHDQIPLLEDIKTEIKQLQDGISGGEEKDQEPEDDPSHDPSPSDPEVPEMRKRIRDSVKDMDKLKRLMTPLRKALPSPEDPIPDWVKDVDWYDLISTIVHLWEMFKIRKDIVEKYGDLSTNIKNLFDGSTTFQEFWKNEEDAAFDALNQLIDEWNEDLEDKIARMFQLGENMDDSLTNCCQTMNQRFNNVDDAVDVVKGDIDDSVQQLKDLISSLKDQTQDLSDQLDSGVSHLDDNLRLCCQNMANTIQRVIDLESQIARDISEAHDSLESTVRAIPDDIVPPLIDIIQTTGAWSESAVQNAVRGLL